MEDVWVNGKSVGKEGGSGKVESKKNDALGQRMRGKEALSLSGQSRSSHTYIHRLPYPPPRLIIIAALPQVGRFARPYQPIIRSGLFSSACRSVKA
uniref:Bm7879 n=1 Tax=Brugia malayi TaxID=6279 RepID=A0A1I9FZN2_BRUMA|nr:Bm7879 [Brugia malayi]